MHRNRRTKLLATLGPASLHDDVVEALYKAGADVFRINMSHSDHTMLRQRVAQIRALEARMSRPIGILADLQGPKLRLGKFAEGKVAVKVGDEFILDSNDELGTSTRVKLPHPEILEAVKIGHRLLIDDGRMRLRVSETDGKVVKTRVEIAGFLSDRKGVSLPDTLLATSAMTPKDRSDLEAALECNVDWIALSFVQRPDDIAEVKKVAKGRALVMAKIEKPQAFDQLEEIVELADGIMVARGDLGVELPLEAVPGLQKRITRLCRKHGKPVVVATQMLESMITAAAPTRAEVSDVATAVFEGADAVMLSAESAAGQYPIEAVTTMNNIAETVESDELYRKLIDAQRSEPEATGADAIAAAAHDIAETLDLKAIVAWTASGSTALRIARERPHASIVALTTSQATARRMSLVWGVHAVMGTDPSNIDEMALIGTTIVKLEGFVSAGERVLMVAGVPFGTPGATNMLKLAYVK